MDGHHLESSYLCISTYLPCQISPTQGEDVEESSFGNVLLSLYYYYDANNSAYLSNIQLSPQTISIEFHYLRTLWMKEHII
jgi:hypothetical protein